MASTDYCESQEDCYQCEHGKKMRQKLAEYEAEYEDAEREGRVVVLPCKVGQKVYLVKEDLLNCDECPNIKRSKKDEDGYRWIGCPDEHRRCPLYVEEKTAEGFEIHGKDGIAVLSDPGEFGWEGLERLSGIDGTYHLDRFEAENAARALADSAGEGAE